VGNSFGQSRQEYRLTVSVYNGLNMPAREHWMLWDSPVWDFTGVPLMAPESVSGELGMGQQLC